MKRISLLILSLLTVAFLTGCGSEAVQATDPPTTTIPASTEEVDPSALPLFSADGVITYTRTENSLSISVTLAKAAGQEVSLIALTDAAYRLNWWENSHAQLSDLGQIKLDEAGKGSLTLQLKENTTNFCLILTAPEGAYLLEVN